MKLNNHIPIKFILLIGLFLISPALFSQSDIINKRDDRYLKEVAIVNLMNSFEITLNVITAGEAYPNEINNHIDRILNGSLNERIFFNDQVRLENDLMPGADKFKTKEDKIIGDYLEDLISLYSNPEANSIVFDKDYKISGLKRTSYFYYNVVFNSTFKGVNIDNKSYTTVGRVAEVRLLNENGKWYPLIHGIRFYDPLVYDPLSDTLNLFLDFPSTIGDDESYIDYLSKLNAEKSKYWEERDKDVRKLLEESKRAEEDGNIKKADSLISLAWTINPADRMVLASRQSLKTAKEDLAKEKLLLEKKNARITELQKNAIEHFNTYQFDQCKRLIDTLTYNYGVQNNPELNEISKEVQRVKSIFDPVRNAVSVQRHKDATKLCEEIIKKQEDKRMISLAYYHKALILAKSDSIRYASKIVDNLDEAIEGSGKMLLQAIQMRSAMKANLGEFDEALRDASYLVNNYKTNAAYYGLRASIYRSVNRRTEATADYISAVQLETNDPDIYSGKASLELEREEFDNVISTADAAIAKKIADASIYYYRALANVKKENFEPAGADFSRAKQLNLTKEKVRSFEKIANDYFTHGKGHLDNQRIKNAIDELSRSVLLDSTAQSLFWLGRAYKDDLQFDKAEEQFTALVASYPDYKQAYFERGSVRKALRNYEGAVTDFSLEYSKSGSRESVLEKIRTMMLQENFNQAATEAESAATKYSDPDAFQYAVESYYRAKRLEKVLEVFDLAEKLRDVRSNSYYFYGRALYDKGEDRKARSAFEDALSTENKNPEASYWVGTLLFNANKFEDAFIMFENALPSKEYKSDAIYFRALCRIKMRESGNYKLAAADIEIVLNENPEKFNNAEAISWLSYCYLNLNNDKKALQLLTEAQVSDSTNIIYCFVNACYYSKLNKPEKALEFLELALRTGTSLRKNDIEDEYYFEILKSNQELKSRYKEIIKRGLN
jgi:tetratricopeptide (TPR) repeat protein